LRRAERLQAHELRRRALLRQAARLLELAWGRTGQGLAERVEQARVDAAPVVQRRTNELERCAERREQRSPLLGLQRRELEHHREVVGELLAVEREPGLGIAPLEPDELEPTLPAVAVRVVGEMETAAAVEVERLYVGAPEVRERSRRDRV